MFAEKRNNGTGFKRFAAFGMAALVAVAVGLVLPRAEVTVADWNTVEFDDFILTEGLKDPPNCTVNLIDYWAKNGNSVSQTTPDEYADEASNSNYGINAGHYLTFGATNGAWNTWTNDANTSANGTFREKGLDGNTGNGRGKAYRGIVNYNLGDDGYPRLSLGDYAWTGSAKADFEAASGTLGTRAGGANESLAYLFDPDNTTDAYSHTARRGYADVKGLFRYGGMSGSKDMSGYYWYDSTINFAEMRATNNDTGEEFYYNTTSNADYPADTSYKMRLYTVPLAGNGSGIITSPYAGQFFPLNSVNRGTVGRTDYSLFSVSNGRMTTTQANWSAGLFSGNGMNSLVNHYFGMSMEVEFMQPAGYQVDDKDMTFTFAGDDDVWIFCDDVLIADLGGNHNALACDVNFSTGEIVYYSSQQNVAAYNDVWRVDYLSNCFGADLDYERDVKGWVRTGTVPTTDEELTSHYTRNTWASGRSDEMLDFTMATTNARHPGNESNTAYGTFEELTRHTLKFFFLESGGNMSNCMLKFNLSAIAD